MHSESILREYARQADDRTIAAKMVQVYDSATSDPRAAQHVHRVSRYLLHVGDGCLGSDFRSYARTGVMTSRLRTEITAYQMCMLDDSMVEGPHSSIGRTNRHASKSSPAWWSATSRFQQNSDAREASEHDMVGRFEWFFQHWKILGQRSARKYRRGIMQRISTGDFRNMVYRSGLCNLADWSVLGLRQSAHKAKPKEQQATVTCIRQIQRDYARCVFRSGCTFTLPVSDHIAHVESMAAGRSVSGGQASSLKGVTVVSTDLAYKKHVMTASVADWRRMEVPIIMQTYASLGQADPSATSLDVYEEGFPEMIDLFAFATWKSLSTDVAQWHQEDSDHDGCIKLVKPEFVSARQWLSRE